MKKDKNVEGRLKKKGLFKKKERSKEKLSFKNERPKGETSKK